jgi:hypothetical protein
MHDVEVADVGVAEHHLVDVEVGDQVLEALLGEDRDPVGVAGAGQGGRIGAVVDVGDLGRGEGDHPGRRVAAEGAVEVVEVAAGGPHDEHPSLQARLLASGCRPPLGGTASRRIPGPTAAVGSAEMPLLA